MNKGFYLFCGCLFLIHSGLLGQFVSSVPVSNSNGESFALYLPEQITSEDEVPIIISFAPDGVGAHGVQPFRALAQERGIIVVSSNNSRNGPHDWNFAIAQRLFDHVFSQYKIDPDQIYLAGFSGGSRLASAIAALSGNIAGVIACGAGFSGVPQYNPQNGEGFTWLGIVGDRDFNYTEMLETDVLLDKMNYPHGLQQFSGGHQWPPEEEIKAAFRFMDLQLHTKGKITLSRKQIEKYLEKDRKRIADFKESNDLYKAAAEYDRILKGYRNIISLDNLVQDRETLLSSSAYKAQKKAEDNAIKKEKVLKEQLNQKFQESFKKSEKVPWKFWKKKIAALKEPSEIPAITNMNNRVLYWLYVLTISGENPMVSNTTQDQKEFIQKLTALISER